MVKAVQAVRIAPEIPLTSAALIGCGVLTGVGAVLNRAKVGLGESVVVIGTGGIGLNVIQGARIAGASRIVAVDNNPAKEALARQFGATDFVPTAKAYATCSRRAPTTPSSGRPHRAHPAGHRPPRPARPAILLGVPPADAEASFQVSSMYLDKSILGCRYGSSRPQRDIALYADLYQRAGCCSTNS